LLAQNQPKGHANRALSENVVTTSIFALETRSSKINDLREMFSLCPVDTVQVGLDRRGFGKSPHLAHLDAVNRQPSFGQTAIEPWRKRTCLQANSTDHFGESGKAFPDIIGMSGNGTFANDMAGFIDDANSGLFQ
jgi:hypothetical protein